MRLQVPRLVFSSPMPRFSAVTTNQEGAKFASLSAAARSSPPAESQLHRCRQVDDGQCVRTASVLHLACWGFLATGQRRRNYLHGRLATIGESLPERCRAVFSFGTNFELYTGQHYGRVTDKFLPLPNAMKIS